jgi:hypothetical protein
MTTRIVSPKPLSDFVPDVTLIAFPIPASLAPARWQNVFLSQSVAARVKKMVLILVLRANSGANLDLLWLDWYPAAF